MVLTSSLLQHDALECERPMTKNTESVECKCGRVIAVKLAPGEEVRVECRCGHVMVIELSQSGYEKAA